MKLTSLIGIEPVDFDEGGFNKKSRLGKQSVEMWSSCLHVFRVTLTGALIAAYFQVLWLLPILIFLSTVSYLVADRIESKASSGYPYLEHTDGIGFALLSTPLLAICGVAFFMIVFN